VLGFTSFYSYVANGSHLATFKHILFDTDWKRGLTKMIQDCVSFLRIAKKGFNVYFSFSYSNNKLLKFVWVREDGVSFDGERVYSTSI